MASIFGATDSPPIPYLGLSSEIVNSSQKLVPFLGAGASLAGATTIAQKQPASPDQQMRDLIADQLGLTGAAREYLSEAIVQAFRLQAFESDPNSIVQDVIAKPIPPSASELANALAAAVSYKGAWPYSLLAVASYHEFVFKREMHREMLYRLFASKTEPLPTHELVALAAVRHLKNNTRRDYIVITTNYDRLIERAMEGAHVPYCALTVDRQDRKVDVRFSDSVQAWLGFSDNEYREFQDEQNSKYPELFFFSNRPKPLAVVYKIHGCLYPPKPGRDSIVLSDEDYIRFLKWQGEHGERIVPAAVRSLMHDKGFLYLGYSFSDWNVRGLYEMFVGERPGGKSIQDYAVVNAVNPYESAFFAAQTIHLLVTDLVSFVTEVKKNLTSGPLQETL
jgi:hypothetical protein